MGGAILDHCILHTLYGYMKREAIRQEEVEESGTKSEVQIGVHCLHDHDFLGCVCSLCCKHLVEQAYDLALSAERTSFRYWHDCL